eukprot:gene27802-34578_t
MTFSIHGLAVARGIAIGRAVLVASSRVDVAHYFIKPEQVAAEIERMRSARDVVIDELQRLQLDIPKDAPHELAALLDVHLMLLMDEELNSSVVHWIKERLYNAEWALSNQLEIIARQFDEMDDPYLRERKADVEQVAERALLWQRSLDSPAIIEVDAPISPMLFGLLKPRLLLPRHLRSFDATQQQLIVEHELTHWRRRDLQWMSVGIVLQTLLWFNPFMRLLRSGLSWAQELGCDRDVLRGRPPSSSARKPPVCACTTHSTPHISSMMATTHGKKTGPPGQQPRQRHNAYANEGL